VKFRLAPGLAWAVACCVALTACSSIRMPNLNPFHRKPKPAPEAVHELTLVNADGTPANFPQYWKRNTLLIDLSGIGAAGNFAARLPEDTTWPVRVGVRVRPGSVGQIEILGEERNILPVAAEGTLPIDMEFAPSVYTPKTAAIYISWGPMAAAVEEPAVSAPVAPAFVSPTEVPKPSTEPSAGSASDIVTPAEAQPSLPPGS
jgi:hypothetical protein